MLSYCIRKWGERYHLSDSWCLQLIELAVLAEWIQNGGWRHAEPLDIDGILLSQAVLLRSKPDDNSEQTRADLMRLQGRQVFIEDILLGKPKPFEFHAKWWDRDTARARFEKEFNQYLNDIKNRASHFGQAPEKRNPEHYRWLARYQVKGESTVAIWQSLNNDDRRYAAVKKAIRETAMEIGLSRRKKMGTLAATAEVPIELTTK
jgi:hypothetical protein